MRLRTADGSGRSVNRPSLPPDDAYGRAMIAAVIHGPRDVRAEERPDPRIHTPHDAVVRVVAACVCGSDLWPYRGVTPIREPRPIGHELVGVVEELGSEVTSAQVGDFVILPFTMSCGVCQSCRAGYPAACDLVTGFGSTDYHAAFSAHVSDGDTVVVVGDGAVGLSGVIAARQLGAKRIIAMSRHEDRAALARDFGATDVVAERGADGVAAVRDLLDGGLAD